MLLLRKTQVQSLIRELKSHKLLGEAKKKKRELFSSFFFFFFLLLGLL